MHIIHQFWKLHHYKSMMTLILDFYSEKKYIVQEKKGRRKTPLTFTDIMINPQLKQKIWKVKHYYY